LEGLDGDPRAGLKMRYPGADGHDDAELVARRDRVSGVRMLT
jgi:hypothetical protein